MTTYHHYNIGDKVRFKGDKREAMTGTVANRSVRPTSGGHGPDIHLTILGRDQRFYVRLPRQVKPG